MAGRRSSAATRCSSDHACQVLRNLPDRFISVLGHYSAHHRRLRWHAFPRRALDAFRRDIDRRSRVVGNNGTPWRSLDFAFGGNDWSDVGDAGARGIFGRRSPFWKKTSGRLETRRLPIPQKARHSTDLRRFNNPTNYRCGRVHSVPH